MPDTAMLLNELRGIVGADHVLTDAADIHPYTEDWRGRYRGQVHGVAFPANTEQTSALVSACVRAGVPILPQGGHTGLVGGGTPVGTSFADGTAPVIINLRRMNRIRDVDSVGNTLIAEAGCILQTIQEAAAQHDRLYGVTFGAQGSCQIGGNVSTNAGGTGVLKYGSTRDQVLGLEVVLPDGRVWNGLRTLRKDNTGYALRHLFVGAEGTLGIVTAVALRLHPKPAVMAAAWLTMDSVDHAQQCLAALQSIAGDRIAAFELLNQEQLRTVLAHFPEARLPTDPEAPYAVLLELSDTYAQANLDGMLEDVLPQLSEKGWLRDAAIAGSLAQRHAFWHLRHGISEANRKAGMGLSTDVAVPVRDLAAFIETASRAVTARYPQATIVLVSHMGDGNVHFIPRFSFDDWNALPHQAETADAVRALVHDAASQFNGTFSAEHGVGSVLIDELERLRPPLELELMQRLRNAWDPARLFNPGKVLR